MRILLIDVPYDCGQLNARMGAGPSYPIKRGLAATLRSVGHEVRTESVRLSEKFHTEWDALIALQHQIASLVRSAVTSGDRALVLSGNCGPAALGVLGGLGGRETAVLWMDAHADFNTPDTSPSGFLDGMTTAIAVGHCWPHVATAFQTFDPVPEEHLIQIGVRSVDPAERARLARSRVNRLDGGISNLPALIDRLPDRVHQCYMHIDLDVVDVADFRANPYATSGGLRPRQVAAIIRTVASRLPLSAASITAFDPTLDPERGWTITEQLVRVLAECPSIPKRIA